MKRVFTASLALVAVAAQAAPHAPSGDLLAPQLYCATRMAVSPKNTGSTEVARIHVAVKACMAGGKLDGMSVPPVKMERMSNSTSYLELREELVEKTRARIEACRAVPIPPEDMAIKCPMRYLQVN